MNIIALIGAAQTVGAISGDLKAVDNGQMIVEGEALVRQIIAYVEKYGAPAAAILDKHKAEHAKLGSALGS